MVKHLVLVIALAAAALGSVPAFSSATFIPGPNGKIAFASGRGNAEVPSPADNDDNNARIWVADYPSGTPQQVTHEPTGQHRHPNWSPDHTRIVYAAGVAFSGKYALWIVDLRTGKQTEFVPEAEGQDRPSWSPDGNRIAYAAKGDLWVKDLAPGSEPVQLTEGAAIDERPVWSPDGGTLYYNRGPAADRDLYMKSPVTLGGAEVPILTGVTSDWQPALSPDGKRLCFLRGPQSDGADLWTVNVNGTGPAPFAASAIGDLNCVWSPDGTTILYTLGQFSTGQLVTRGINGGSVDALNSMNVDKHFDGNADWATNFSPSCDPKSASIPVNGFTTVVLSCTDPDFGFGKAPPTPTPLDEDAYEIVSPPSHGTLGGLNDGKVVYTPSKDFKGSDAFTYTGSDGTSDAPPATATISVGQTGPGNKPPLITKVGITNKRWRVGGKLATISKAPVGTTILFTLSEPATATVAFQRARPGRRVGRSCVKQTAANRTKKACTRYVSVNPPVTRAAKAGKNPMKFQGRLSASKTLSPGKYRFIVRARDAGGETATPRTGPSFKIVSE